MKSIVSKVIYLLFLSILFSFYSCKNSLQVSQDLELIPIDTIFSMVRSQSFPKNPNIIIEDENGNVLTIEEFLELGNPRDYKQDYYWNKDREIKKMVLSLANEEDKILFDSLVHIDADARIKKDFNNIIIVDVDCNDRDKLLDEVFIRDQSNRANGPQAMNPVLDEKNLSIVVSLYNKCKAGFFEKLPQRSAHAIWLAIQHSSLGWRKEFYPKFQELHQQNLISAEQLALMEDRMLMDQNLPQKYGSQIQNDKLYKFDNIDSLRVRRAVIGLEDIEVYLGRFGLKLEGN